jgi:hypothetical protein
MRLVEQLEHRAGGICLYETDALKLTEIVEHQVARVRSRRLRAWSSTTFKTRPRARRLRARFRFCLLSTLKPLHATTCDRSTFPGWCTER